MYARTPRNRKQRRQTTVTSLLPTPVTYRHKRAGKISQQKGNHRRTLHEIHFLFQHNSLLNLRCRYTLHKYPSRPKAASIADWHGWPRTSTKQAVEVEKLTPHTTLWTGQEHHYLSASPCHPPSLSLPVRWCPYTQTRADDDERHSLVYATVSGTKGARLFSFSSKIERANGSLKRDESACRTERQRIPSETKRAHLADVEAPSLSTC